jgi:3'-5' exoribonuclease
MNDRNETQARILVAVERFGLQPVADLINAPKQTVQDVCEGVFDNVRDGHIHAIGEEFPNAVATVSELTRLAMHEPPCSFGARALVKYVEHRETKAGKPYSVLTLCDRSGSIEARFWGCRVDVEAGEVIEAVVRVDTYEGKPQATLVGLSVTEEEAGDFVPSSRFDPTWIEGKISALLRADYYGFAGACLEAIREAPASERNHHAYRHGLLEHTWSMLMLADEIRRHYTTHYGMEICRERVYLGVLLHDLGKIYDSEGVWHETTPHRHLVGHMAAGIRFLEEHKHLLDADLRDDLAHIILSHHGTKEWGSPVVPATIEAIIVHQVDLLDSRVAIFREHTQHAEPGEWTGYCRLLGAHLRAGGPS